MYEKISGEHFSFSHSDDDPCRVRKRGTGEKKQHRITAGSRHGDKADGRCDVRAFDDADRDARPDFDTDADTDAASCAGDIFLRGAL